MICTRLENSGNISNRSFWCIVSSIYETVMRFGCQLRLSAAFVACSPARAWRRCDGVCMGVLASRNSNWELVSYFFIFRPIADTICHRLLKLSSVRHWRRVWMVMSAFLRAEMTSTVLPWRYQHTLLVLLRITFSTHNPKTKSQIGVNKALSRFLGLFLKTKWAGFLQCVPFAKISLVAQKILRCPKLQSPKIAGLCVLKVILSNTNSVCWYLQGSPPKKCDIIDTKKLFKSLGLWFKSFTLLLSRFVLGSPEFNSSTALCK